MANEATPCATRTSLQQFVRFAADKVVQGEPDHTRQPDCDECCQHQGAMPFAKTHRRLRSHRPGAECRDQPKRASQGASVCLVCTSALVNASAATQVGARTEQESASTTGLRSQADTSVVTWRPATVRVVAVALEVAIAPLCRKSAR